MKRVGSAVVVLALVALGGITSGGLGQSRSTVSLKACGVERWAIKTLSDSAASRVQFTPRATTVATLRSLADPHTKATTPRLAGTERTTYRVTAELVAIKREADQDVHLVIAQPGTRTRRMIVEFPDTTHCRGAASSAKRAQMLAARQALITACGLPPGPSSSFRTLRGTATVTGVGFFDVRHATPQRGVAPNNIELHPVLAFRATSCR